LKGERVTGKNYRRRITIDPQVHFGKPCVTGTRISVENVVELMQEGIPFEEIVQRYYPDIEIEDIKAWVQYAVDI